MQPRNVAAALLSLLLLTSCAATPRANEGPATTGETDSDRVAGEWVELPESPLSARQGVSAQVVGTRFVLIGGSTDLACPPTASCVPSLTGYRSDGAVYDPDTRTWQRIAEAPVPVSFFSTAAIDDSLYLLGAADLTTGDDVFLRYDLGAEEWQPLPDPPTTGSSIIATDTQILAIAGTNEFGPTEDAFFSPTSGAWTPLPPDPLGDSFNRSAVWLGDRLLLSGQQLIDNPGAEAPSLTRMAELNADLTTWTLLSDSPIIGGSPLAVGDDVIFPERGSADGGEVGNWGRFYDLGGIWNASTGEWKTLPAGRPDPAQHGLWTSARGAVSSNLALLDDSLLNLSERTWSRIPEPPRGTRLGQTVVVGEGAVLVWGGTDGAQNVADGAILYL